MGMMNKILSVVQVELTNPKFKNWIDYQLIVNYNYGLN